MYKSAEFQVAQPFPPLSLETRPAVPTELTQTAPKFDTALALLTKVVLDETKATPLEVPVHKTPLVERAKSIGADHHAALAWTNRLIAQMQKRADAAQAKLDAKKSEIVEYHMKFYAAIQDLERQQSPQNYMQQTTDVALLAVLTAAGLKRDKATIRKAREALLRRQVETAFNRLYRTCVNGTTDCTLAQSSGIEQTSSTDWNLYRGSFKGWAANILDTTISVRPDYWTRVSAANIQVVEGCLVLDARPVHNEMEPAGFRSFKATWITQGRGNSVKIANGYIVTSNTARPVLGESLEQAIKLAQRAARP